MHTAAALYMYAVHIVGQIRVEGPVFFSLYASYKYRTLGQNVQKSSIDLKGFWEMFRCYFSPHIYKYGICEFHNLDLFRCF